MKTRLLSRIYNIKLKWLLSTMLLLVFILVLVMNIVYYFVSSNFLESQAKTYFSNVSNLLEFNVNVVNENVMKIAENICNEHDLQQYISTQEDIDMHKTIVSSMLNTISLNNYIETIKIFSHKGFTISATANEPVATFSFLHKYNIPDGTIDKPFFTETFISLENKNVYYAYVYPVHSIELSNFGENLGTAIILINLDKVFQQNAISSYTKSIAYLVYNSNNEIIYNLNISDNLKDFLSYSLAKGMNPSSGVSKVKDKGKSYFYSITAIPNLEWLVLVAIPQSELGNQMGDIGFAALIISIISVFAVFLIAVLLIKSIYNPLHSMMVDMSKVSIGEHHLHINVPTKNEIGSLANSINQMLDELNTTARKIITTQNVLYETEIAKNKSEMIALQSQISPHFLYNTLECIQSIAVENNVKDISTITTSMARIYRYAISEDSIVSLQSELACVNYYLKIMRIRFQCITKLDLQIPEHLLNAKIFRMSLQPIVENAFTHGLEKMRGNGFIRIVAYEEGNHIVITVMDSGKMITLKQAAEINNQLRNDRFLLENYNINGGIALVNINRRLFLGGDAGCGLFVSVSDDGYAVFKLVFPGSE